jgi:hypothetical protein
VQDIRGEDASLLRREFKHAAGMTRLALARGLALRDDPASEPRRLKQQVQAIERRHRDCWLARNRPGGLTESCSWFRRIVR